MIGGLLALQLFQVLFLGLHDWVPLGSWWLPYLVTPDPVRAARYRTMFGRTHGFLPERNGITPNTLHIVLHVATLATLILLVFLP